MFQRPSDVYDIQNALKQRLIMSCVNRDSAVKSLEKEMYKNFWLFLDSSIFLFRTFDFSFGTFIILVIPWAFFKVVRDLFRVIYLPSSPVYYNVLIKVHKRDNKINKTCSIATIMISHLYYNRNSLLFIESPHYD